MKWIVASFLGLLFSWYLIPVILLVIGFGWFILEFFRAGNFNFWKEVKNDPDAFYGYFLESKAWYVIDGIHNRDKPIPNESDWDGPYRLVVPSLNKTVTIYGKVGQYKEEQLKILEVIHTAKNASEKYRMELLAKIRKH